METVFVVLNRPPYTGHGWMFEGNFTSLAQAVTLGTNGRLSEVDFQMLDGGDQYCVRRWLSADRQYAIVEVKLDKRVHLEPGGWWPHPPPSKRKAGSPSS